MKTFLFFIFYFLINSLEAQLPNFSWAISIGSSTVDVGNSIAVDEIGNVYTLGTFNGTVDLDPGQNNYNAVSTGTNNVFLQKLDPTGNFLWGAAFDCKIDLNENSLLVDTSGIYIIGGFKGTVDFNPDATIHNVTALGTQDVFILKLNSNGNFIWVKNFGGNGGNVGYSITKDKTGNIITSGTFNKTTDFDPGIGTYTMTALSDPCGFIHKMDRNGNFIWVKQFGKGLYDASYPITVKTDHNNSIFSSGMFYGIIDFNPSTISSYTLAADYYDAYINKLDSNGNFLWVKSFGSYGTEVVNSQIVDSLGNIYSVGNFQGACDFDPGVGIYNLPGPNDFFIQKLDNSGNFIWAKSIGGPNVDQGLSIKNDKLGNIYVVGKYGPFSVDLNTGIDTNIVYTNGVNDNLFVLKLDVNGNFLWGKGIGSSGNDYSQAIAIDFQNNIYFTGAFESTVNFNPNNDGTTNSITSLGGKDAFVCKWRQCANSKSLIVNACDSYSLNNQTYTVSGTYNQYLQNIFGCDSVVNIKLTINKSSSKTLTITACNSYSLNNQTYSVSGTYYQTLNNVFGCDSIIRINLTVNSFTSAISYNNNGILSVNTNSMNYIWVDCANNYSIIPSQTAQTYTPTFNGNYAAIVTSSNANCSYTTNCISINDVGISENDLINKNIKIYPNPNAGFFTIESKESYILSVYNVYGQEIFNKQIFEGKNNIDLFDKCSGVYFIKIKNDTGNYSFRIIKN